MATKNKKEKKTCGEKKENSLVAASESSRSSLSSESPGSMDRATPTTPTRGVSWGHSVAGFSLQPLRSLQGPIGGRGGCGFGMHLQSRLQMLCKGLIAVPVGVDRVVAPHNGQGRPGVDGGHP
jgi:hypothetical protein